MGSLAQVGATLVRRMVAFLLLLVAGCGEDEQSPGIVDSSSVPEDGLPDGGLQVADALGEAVLPDGSADDGPGPETRGPEAATPDAIPDSLPPDVPPADLNLSDLPPPDEGTPDESVPPDGPPPPDLCVPSCSGKDCGDDGCGAMCGECPPDKTCSEAGTCLPFPCESSKDCPGKLVCLAETGQCVACIGSEDCPPGLKCNVLHLCYEPKLCDSDKDCKQFDMVCEKNLGECVECLATPDCPPVEYCAGNVCVPDVCAQGLTLCLGAEVFLCNEEGSASAPVETCSPTQYCEDGACKDQICVPNSLFCEGDVAKICDEIGKQVVAEEDCSAQQLKCFAGECKEFACSPPGGDFCVSPGDLGHCAQDQMSFTSDPCPEGTYCLGGQCVPWFCTPGTPVCADNMATACDEYGAAPLPNGVDCGVLGQCCLYGGCVPPQEEVCDGVDNNCNGTVDEGVLSQCGDCNPKCGEALAGPDGDLPFVPTPDNAWGMEVDDSGSLLVKLGQPLPEHVWIANSEENTISKLSTATGQETGRYTTCANPSRTAVDLHGNVWVACRNDGGVAKIAGSTAFCKDKNADGLLQTSADANGDGKISAQEMLPAGSDECIRFIVYPGGSCQRSLGVDKQNFAWVGEWYSMTLRRLSPDNGATVKSVVLPANPYGLVIDGSGIVWISGRGGYKLVRYDPATGAIETYVSTLAAFEPYGITLDSLGRVWVANCCSAHVAHRFDPITKAWALATVSARPRGIAGSITGQVWVANDESNKVTVVDAASAQTLGAVDLGLGHFPIGVGLDFGGFVWTVNQASSSASKIDPAQMKVVGEYPVGKGPYTYSDFSGYILYNFTAPVNQAYYTAQFGDPLGAAVTWKQLSVDFDQDGEDCATLEVLGRIGDTVQALAGSAWTTLSSGPLPQELDLDLLDFALHSKLMEAKLVIYLKKDTCTIKITGATVQFVAD